MAENRPLPKITLELDHETYDSLVELAERDEISVEDCAYNMLYEGLSAELEDEWDEEEADDDEDDEQEHRDPWGKGT